MAKMKNRYVCLRDETGSIQYSLLDSNPSRYMEYTSVWVDGFCVENITRRIRCFSNVADKIDLIWDVDE